MGETSEQLRAEIAGTRADMTATLDAITDRTSPKRMVNRQVGRLRGGVSSIRDSVMGSARDFGDATSGTVSGVGDRMRDTPDGLQGQTRGNPLAAGMVAFGAGLLVASILPATEKEKQATAMLSDRAQPLVDQAQQAAHDVAGDLRSSAEATAQRLEETATEAAGAVRSQAGHPAGVAAESAKRAAGS